ncbi:hypothetical protein GOP47_0021333 [Adiantum capillus-veneris]|uniref:Uncharacterized protein n=1 Tax=Adiantum capillus-veneris TaxID=13818 RepID=A0A9D4UAW5_ADICA|nr:hypothetical protein GOP47_0021333 [Adiantum capillus-veneris]
MQLLLDTMARLERGGRTERNFLKKQIEKQLGSRPRQTRRWDATRLLAAAIIEAVRLRAEADKETARLQAETIRLQMEADKDATFTACFQDMFTMVSTWTN